MIKSMTGYGYFEVADAEHKVTAEIKSVNHRYCDLGIKLPKKFNAFESKIRNIVKEYAGRGKIDLYINYENYVEHRVEITYHKEIAGEYFEAVRKAGEDFSLEQGLTAASLIRYPEVITIEEREQDVASIYPKLEKAVTEAAKRFLETKKAEGEHLQKDIENKLEYVLEQVSFIESRSPEILKEYREKIMAKVEEFLGDKKLDEGVLATELAIFADKVCVDEETVRLRSHVNNMRETLKKEDAVGRKLDFIAQEMNREANTILSKANDRELSARAIDLKTEIEKIREQIQNIE